MSTENDKALKRLKVAIIHPFFFVLGGAEHFLAELCKVFPHADIYTLFSGNDFIPAACKRHRITTSFLQKVPGILKYHRLLVFLQPLAVESFDLRGYDLVISSDSSVAKGVLTSQDTVHICYCHTTTRYLWDYYATFLAKQRGLKRLFFRLVAHRMRLWDFQAAQRVDFFVANSRYIAHRIWKYYRRPSTVIYNPVSVEKGYLASRTDEYYLTVGRMTESKRMDLVIEACNRLGRRLKIAGTGVELERLRAMAGPTVEFCGRVSDEELAELYSHCRALVFAADEDFGLVSLEAQAYGRPVIAYERGGNLETINGRSGDSPRTGVFFQKQTADDIEEAILRFEAEESQFVSADIRERALTFNHETFARSFSDFAMEKIREARFHPLPSAEEPPCRGS